MTERGRYIVGEGGDGTGKTTVANLVTEHLRKSGRRVIRIDEPDSAYEIDGEPLVPIASELRRIIKDGSLGRSALTNALLFTASRYENWNQIALPALEKGIDVVSARNYWSTLVYQGDGEGFDHRTLIELTRLAMGFDYMNPDYGFILDLDDEKERLQRIANRGVLEVPDTFESRGDDFHGRVRHGYLKIAKTYQLPVIAVKGKTPDMVAQEVIERIQL